MFVQATIDFGGGQPAEVSFSISKGIDDGSPVVGLHAVVTAAGDILGTLAKPDIERVKQAALDHIKEMLP